MSTGRQCDAAPCTFRVPRKHSFFVTVSKDGYVPSTVRIHPVIGVEGTVAFLGNAAIGGLIGAAIDVGTGAPAELRPNPLKVTLQALPPGARPVLSSEETDAAPHASDPAIAAAYRTLSDPN